MTRTLVVGFGNIFRRDDGVGFAVLNALRERLGMPPLSADAYGYDALGHDLDTLFVHQLVPELAEVIAGYDLVVFVDAHTGVVPDLIREKDVVAGYGSTQVSHQLAPCALLAMARDLYAGHPRGMLLSIRGYDFDFGEELSTQTAALVTESVDRILAWMADDRRDTVCDRHN